jgi:signal transduction histidine kinase
MVSAGERAASPTTSLWSRQRWRELWSFVLPPVPESYAVERQSVQAQRGVIMLWYIVLVYGGFYGLDVLQYPEHWRLFGFMRLVPVSWSVFCLFLCRGRPAVARFGGTVAFFSGTATVVSMCVITEGFGSTYLVGVILCFVGVCTIELTTPWVFVVYSLSMLALHITGNALFDEHTVPGEVPSAIFFLGGAALLCSLAAFILEHQRRRVFLTGIELAEKNAALDHAIRNQREFFNKMTHELRSPVNSILGFTELLRENERLAEPDQKKLQRIDSSAERLLQVIADILALARHEAVGLQLHVTPIALKPLLEEMSAMGAAVAGKRPVVVRYELDDEGLGLESDETRLRQILINLVSNAVKFTPEGEVIIAAHRQGEGLSLSVADTGIGIPADKQAQLFSAFAQASSGHERIGTGLGLNIVRQFAELLGGAVAFDSQEGRGTRFTLSLPIRPTTKES